jgi:hypothetical protein
MRGVGDLRLSLSRRSGAVAFDPASLFGASDQGAVYDFSDFDEAVSRPAMGRPAVSPPNARSYRSRCTDLSGKGNHATQGTAASEPPARRYQGYLESFDGTDDELAAAGIDMSRDGQGDAGLCMPASWGQGNHLGGQLLFAGNGLVQRHLPRRCGSSSCAHCIHGFGGRKQPGASGRRRHGQTR